MVGANLMTQPARTAMDQNNYLVSKEAIGFRTLLIQHTGDTVNFEKVVARTKCTQLIASTLARMLADQGGIGARQPAILFRMQNIFGGGKIIVQTPLCAAVKEIIKLIVTQPVAPLFTYAAGAIPIKRSGKVIEMRFDFIHRKSTCQQAHATVNVIANRTRRNHAVRQARGSHPTDGKAIALVDIRHGDGMADNS